MTDIDLGRERFITLGEAIASLPVQVQVPEIAPRA